MRVHWGSCQKNRVRVRAGCMDVTQRGRQKKRVRNVTPFEIQKEKIAAWEWMSLHMSGGWQVRSLLGGLLFCQANRALRI